MRAYSICGLLAIIIFIANAVSTLRTDNISATLLFDVWWVQYAWVMATYPVAVAIAVAVAVIILQPLNALKYNSKIIFARIATNLLQLWSLIEIVHLKLIDINNS